MLGASSRFSLRTGTTMSTCRTLMILRISDHTPLWLKRRYVRAMSKAGATGLQRFMSFRAAVTSTTPVHLFEYHQLSAKSCCHKACLLAPGGQPARHPSGVPVRAAAAGQGGDYRAGHRAA